MPYLPNRVGVRMKLEIETESKRGEGEKEKENLLCSLFPKRLWASQVAKWSRICLPAWVQSLGLEDFLEEEMATHSSVLAWEIPWTEGLASYNQ